MCWLVCTFVADHESLFVGDPGISYEPVETIVQIDAKHLPQMHRTLIGHFSMGVGAQIVAQEDLTSSRRILHRKVT